MSWRRFARATGTLAIGYASAGALFWALLNVPESNPFMLALSAALAVAVVAAVGITTAAAGVIVHGEAPRDVVRGSIRALPAFVAGLAVFCVLWLGTEAIDTWWQAYHGETDALLIRYLNVTRSQPLHQTVMWSTWLVRWVLGLSVVVALATSAAVREPGGLRSAMRHAVRVVSLLCVLATTLLVGRLWRLVYWRPSRIPPWLEPTFTASKLAILYVTAAALLAAALVVFQRAGRRTSI